MEKLAPDISQEQRNQMLRGEDSEGGPITNQITGSDRYSESYARKKGKSRPIDLHDKGDFQGDIFTDVRNDTYVIESGDIKRKMLTEVYGEQIFGLNKNSKVDVVAKGRPVLISEVKTELSK